MIDYADFSFVMMRFYRNERRKRRNAIRMMFQSRKVSGGSDEIDFERFVAMIQSLGFRGSMDDVFDLFREALTISRGGVTLDPLLMAMDNLSFHFYVIDVPFQMFKPFESVKMPKPQLMNHWMTFSAWFEGFNEVKDQIDSWLLSKITTQVREVDKLFKSSESVSDLYNEYRHLLDWFQFMLEVIAKGKRRVLSTTKAERQLKLLENLIDLLITFVVQQTGDQITFTEFE
jgi:hypothetical protein